MLEFKNKFNTTTSSIRLTRSTLGYSATLLRGRVRCTTTQASWLDIADFGSVSELENISEEQNSILKIGRNVLRDSRPK